MPYPERLLPKNNYKKINSELLTKNSQLLRATEIYPYVDSLGKVKIDAILLPENYSQVFDLSVNLLGIYQVDDKKYKISDKDLNKLWSENDDCLSSLNDDQYSVLDNIHAIFFEVGKIHDKKFPFEKIVDNTNTMFKGVSIAEHVPTIGNFWHFQIMFKEVDGEFIRKSGAGWKKKLRGFLVKSYLKKFAKPIHHTIQLPDKKLYTK
jgi:hypothetical protein